MPVRLVALLPVGVALALLGSCGGADSGQEAPPSRADASRALQRVVADAREDAGAAGIAAAVVERGRLSWSGGSGVGDLRTRRPVTGDTAFAIGSVSKTFVAALALRLSEEGALGLDDRAAEWVPRAAAGPTATLRQLLGHTSGLSGVDEHPDYFPAVDREPGRRWTPQRTLRYVRRPDFRPGEGWHYSDTNYVLAGLAIERAGGTSAAEQLRRLLSDPLDLEHTGLQPEDDPPEAAAHGHGDPERSGTIRDLSRGMRWIAYDSAASSEWTAGGMFSTAESVARFGDALLRGKLVRPASLRAMTDFTSVGFASYIGYGLGVGRRFLTDLGGDLWGSVGRVPGFHADLWHVPSRDVTVAVLANDERVDTTQVADALLAAANGSG